MGRLFRGILYVATLEGAQSKLSLGGEFLRVGVLIIPARFFVAFFVIRVTTCVSLRNAIWTSTEVTSNSKAPPKRELGRGTLGVFYFNPFTT